MATSVPADNDLIGSSVSEQQFKTGLAQFLQNAREKDTSISALTDQVLPLATSPAALVKTYDPALNYKGGANPQTTVPASPKEKDCYLVSISGTVFGVLAEQGQLIIRTPTGWRLGELYETYQRQLQGTESGGQSPLAVAYNFAVSGHLNSSGIITASGYQTTYLKPVVPGQNLSFASAGSSTVSVVAFYDLNMGFISSILGNGSAVVRTAIVPANAAYVRLSNNPGLVALPFCNVIINSVINTAAVVKQNDFTVETSLNLARLEYIINNFYVNNTGSITAGEGWKYIKIPVVAGKTYTFGGFSITTSGYYTVFNAASNTVLMNGSYQTGTLPKTLTIPDGGAWLAYDICRPNTDPTLYAHHRAFEGSLLLDYVEPVDTILRIKGLKLAGTSDGGETSIPENVVTQGGNAVLADIIADSITIAALFSNLPLSNDPDLQIGQFYEDDNGFVKVRR
ncbi:hypothetical protein GWP85_13375 [Acinetobacter beijerinckii]|uniref:hypothetical protein n=1 Tax=Acinetobacter beijerinckii TaxID=262668 RepID=UPI0023DD8492|nr:hypothetical protein [Acinetobacter beijerinckii]MDF2418486.1 hypothetical protein [Acinetobacter beijerinckii]